MTSIVSSPAQSWVGAHRVFMIIVAFVITLAAATTFVLLTSSSSSSPSTTPTAPTAPASWPVSPENLSDYEKCVMAHVRVC